MTVGLSTPVLAQAEATTPTVSFSDLIAEVEQPEQILRKLVLETGGMYTVRAPANSGLQVLIDGNLLIDATGTRLDDVGTDITAFVSLDAGAHAVTIMGVDEENSNIGEVTVNLAGQAPEQLFALTTELDDLEAAEILTARAALPGASEAAPVLAASSSPFTPFAIGGGSSEGARSATAAGSAAVQMASATPSATAPSMTSETSSTGGGTTTVASSASPMSPGASVSSGIPSTPVSGGGTPTAPGAPPAPGTPPAPGAPPAPTPTPTPPATPTTAATTPLTPPEVELTEVVQLTSAGNEEGLVPSTGTTLFGAVMTDTVFDQVAVTFDPPRDEPTIVSVGAETGQFAVRMFPEDFAGASEVTVTLVGQLSSNAEVSSEPISYTVTGGAVQDGVGQALSRLTFGATPELYARVRAIGFEAFVNEQLNPDTINNSAFNAMNPNGLLDLDNGDNNFMNSLRDYDFAHAAFTERQLEEVMARFWANHFHAVTKMSNVYLQNLTDREFYRENAFGNFEDMLLYSARSPLMSQYLDNDANRVNNLNENYAREILELSSVGVNGGYSEDDIIEVAKIFTGWDFRRVNEGQEGLHVYEFEFRPDRHDTSDKVLSEGFLNMTIAGRSGAEGVQEGEELIAILAQHPSTRNFVCGKIVQLLVADEAPADLVAACAAAWETSGGEVVPMLEAILLDPSYITTVEYQRNKVKSPFEFATSFVRAFGASPVSGEEDNFYRRFRELYMDAGYIPLTFSDPTGLPEVGAAWTSSAKMVAMYERMNTITERAEEFGIDLVDDLLDAGLETAEEVAGYLLAVSTGDRFTKPEFDTLVTLLNGNDGFTPLDPDSDESRSVRQALAAITVTPSFLLQ